MVVAAVVAVVIMDVGGTSNGGRVPVVTCSLISKGT